MNPEIQQFPPSRHSTAGHGQEHGHAEDAHHQEHAHHEPNFWQKYIFSSDHKIIGIQYGITALAFMWLALMLMLLMRWQIAHPGKPVPILGPVLASILGQPAAGGVISPDLYNSFGAMHGTMMVFSWNCATGFCRLWQLRGASHDWRA